MRVLQRGVLALPISHLHLSLSPSYQPITCSITRIQLRSLLLCSAQLVRSLISHHSRGWRKRGRREEGGRDRREGGRVEGKAGGKISGAKLSYIAELQQLTLAATTATMYTNYSSSYSSYSSSYHAY